jgi:hypothetical protein
VDDRFDSVAASEASWGKSERSCAHPFDPPRSPEDNAGADSHQGDSVAVATLNEAYASISMAWVASPQHNEVGYRLWQLGMEDTWTVKDTLCVNLGRIWRDGSVNKPSLWQLVLFLSIVKACRLSP